MKIRKILIANRGEIAIRVARACKTLGILSVAIYSEIDANAKHVRLADESYPLGGKASNESYLLGDKIIDIAKKAQVDAIHPGYGFLSENADFARKVTAAGLIWIGPPPEAIEAMGSKTESRQRMIAAGVPVVPGNAEPLTSMEEARQLAASMGYPIMLKAAAGGGGKGMREVTSEDELENALQSARSEARNSFGDDSVYMEKRVVNPRHVEVQVLADAQGNVYHVFERDCSIQRRHQKVIEEAPCPILREDVRSKMTQVAIDAAKAVNYVGAGTVEFLLDEDQNFYFLEMNTRLQVEHPISEMITGIDLVQWQIRIASGESFNFKQSEIQKYGHALEFRIYAEDSSQNWAPSPGIITEYIPPEGPWVRLDSGVGKGDEVSVYYDPMIAKLVVWGIDRDDAIRRSLCVLDEFCIAGITTTIPFMKAVLRDPDFCNSNITTGFLSVEKMETLMPSLQITDEEKRITEDIAVLFRYANQIQNQTQSTSKTSVVTTSNWKQRRSWKWQ